MEHMLQRWLGNVTLYNMIMKKHLHTPRCLNELPLNQGHLEITYRNFHTADTSLYVAGTVGNVPRTGKCR